MDPIFVFCFSLEVVLVSSTRWRQTLYLWPGFTSSCQGGVMFLHAQRQDQIQEFKTQGKAGERLQGASSSLQAEGYWLLSDK